MVARRPIIWITCAYVAGILIKKHINLGLCYIYIALVTLILIIIAMVRLKKWQEIYSALILIVFLIIGFVNTYIHSIPNRDLDFCVGQATNIYGQILEIVKAEDSKSSFIIETHKLEHLNVNYGSKVKIRATIYSTIGEDKPPIIEVGDYIQIIGRLEKPHGQRNPRGFNYRDYLARRGIHYITGVPSKNIALLGSGRLTWPQSWLKPISDYMERVFDKYIGGRESNLLKAMVIGKKWSLPSEIKKQFTETGVAHILAISGLHIGFVILLLSWLAKGLKLSPGITFLFQGTILGFYCLLVGGNPSVVRATIMGLIFLGGKVIGRKSDPLNNVSLAALIILLFKPLELMEVGFQLSFGAVSGIILCGKLIRDGLGEIPETIKAPLAIMLGAQLGVWPLIAYHFNIFSPISIIANFILVPLAGAIVMLGFTLLIVAAVSPILARVLAPWLWTLCCGLIDGNGWLSGLSWSSLKVLSPGILFMASYYIILLLISQERPGWIKKPLYLGGALVLVMLLTTVLRWLPVSHLEVVFVDVGQGDCIYIKTPDGKHILVDGGGRSSEISDFDVGEEVVIPFLLKNGVKRLDLVIMSHVHDDHIGGLIPVLKDLRVKTFMEYPPIETSDKYGVLKDIVTKKGIECIQAESGQTYKVGKEVFLDIIYPNSNRQILEGLYEQNDNNISLVIRVRYQDTAVLLTGDIEDRVESYLSDIWDGNISLLKVAHHGSKTSSTEKWLDTINPDIAVIQSGKNNFGHPAPEVVQRFIEKDVILFRNNIMGGVTCRYKGGKWYITTIISP